MSAGYMIGSFVGGLLLVTIFSMILEWAVFKRVFDDPVKGKVVTVITAWLVASVLGGFGMADGGPFNAFAFVLYGIPALVVLFFYYKKGVELREYNEYLQAEEAARPFE